MKEIEQMNIEELRELRDTIDLEMGDLIQEQDMLADKLRRIDYRLHLIATNHDGTS